VAITAREINRDVRKEKPEIAVTGSAPFESRFFQYTNDIQIHYQKSGHGPVPLVFLHGFASAHTTWHDMARHFPADRLTLFLLDMKGFGLSAKPRDGAYSVEDQAAIVKAFITEQRLRSVILIGHSLGGAVALRVCLQTRGEDAPLTIQKLVLIDCAAYPQKLPKFFRRLRSPVIGPLLLRLIPVRKMVRTTLEKVFFDPSAVTPERIEQYARYFRGKGIPYALRATVKGIDPADYVRISESYRELIIPTLIIWGKEDRIIRLKHGHRLHKDIAVSHLKVLKKCGHSPQEERPEETFSSIEAFLGTE
jgi:pimeloyl-ACP methyl ester carboxylesterase